MGDELSIAGRVGMVARFKPLHNGHAVILETIGKKADEFLIGLGSANIYDHRNPWTADESRGMIDAFLSPRLTNYAFIEVIDLFDGPKWRLQILDRFGALDAFVTANDYVRTLLDNDYTILHPLAVIPPASRTPVTGTDVRYAMATSVPWRPLVPPAVADYLTEKGLVERFRTEFGLETLARAVEPIIRPEIGDRDRDRNINGDGDRDKDGDADGDGGGPRP